MSDIIPLSLLWPFACKCCQASVLVSETVPAAPQALSKTMRYIINFSLFDAKKVREDLKKFHKCNANFFEDL